ncbi:Adenosylcobinamide-GDP ribazoletransferase [bacterium HR37]|nr:Adenosylcobinamide-GDP ribazoletransferase [bacterium HR37]
MMSIQGTFRKLKAAVEFLTLFKIGKRIELTREDIANSLPLFPIVGILLGGVCAILELLLRNAITSELLRSLFPVAILAVLTRGLHLDGVADCFDALNFAHFDRERALEIMKGRTIGSFGASTLIMVLVGKTLSIYALPEDLKIQNLILIPSISRWTSAIVARQCAPALPEGLGYIFTVYSTRKAFFTSGILTLLLSFSILGTGGIKVFVAISVISFALASFFNRTFGGVTGDVFGAVIELSEFFGFILGGVLIKG